jgi:hypothetical protein
MRDMQGTETKTSKYSFLFVKLSEAENEPQIAAMARVSQGSEDVRILGDAIQEIVQPFTCGVVSVLA